MTTPAPRFYDELAEWWPLFSPPDHYVEEAEDLLLRLGRLPADPRPTLLELGSGGGHLASHLRRHFALTLTDRAEGMLAVSRALNPDADHVAGDMRTLRLGREFDVVLIHDAIAYATTQDDLRDALQTAAVHCRRGGAVVVLPDFVKETFADNTDSGGEDAADGRGFRYLEWCWDPDPADDTYVVDYAFLLREANGDVRAVHDRHIEGIFSYARWIECFAAAGLEAASDIDKWNRHVFIARPVR